MATMYTIDRYALVEVSCGFTAETYKDLKTLAEMAVIRHVVNTNNPRAVFEAWVDEMRLHLTENLKP
jgi:hypothetical protein